MATSGTTIVLGWDALDYELCEEFGLSGAFGAHTRTIDTFDNPVVGAPQTWEVWPTMITGVGPDEHGIVHSSSSEGVDWENPAINLAANIAAGIVPQSVRTEIGRWIRNSGAGLDQHGPDYYAENDIPTVFDDRVSRPISIPNYHTELDEQLGLTFDRADVFNDYIDKHGADGEKKWEPTVGQEKLESRLAAEVMQRAGIVRSALHREHDIVWVWFGYLDTVGHLEPSLEEPLQERAYHVAANVTQTIKSEAAMDDRVLVVSDHGLRKGKHTHDAFFGGDEKRLVDSVESVFDVASVVERVTPRSSDVPTVRDEWSQKSSDQDMAVEEVEESLEDLGYI